MHLKYNLLLIIFACTSYFHVYGQESVNASGGNASGSGGSNSYSVGQVLYITHGSGDTEAQGVQHAYEIYIIDGIEDSPEFSFSVYPNPTTDGLILETDEVDLENLSFHLLDNTGKLIEQSSILSNKTYLDLSTLARSSYILTIFNNEVSQSFKILKK